MLVATKVCLSRQRLVTKVSLRQNILSRQKFCRDEHTFVATKIILVAAPASDTNMMERFDAVKVTWWKGVFCFEFFGSSHTGLLLTNEEAEG